MCCVNSISTRGTIRKPVGARSWFWRDGRRLGEVLRILTVTEKQGEIEISLHAVWSGQTRIHAAARLSAPFTLPRSGRDSFCTKLPLVFASAIERRLVVQSAGE